MWWVPFLFFLQDTLFGFDFQKFDCNVSWCVSLFKFITLPITELLGYVNPCFPQIQTFSAIISSNNLSTIFCLLLLRLPYYIHWSTLQSSRNPFGSVGFSSFFFFLFIRLVNFKSYLQVQWFFFPCLSRSAVKTLPVKFLYLATVIFQLHSFYLGILKIIFPCSFVIFLIFIVFCSCFLLAIQAYSWSCFKSSVM